jgi:PAS domain S-box-containing protein
MRGALIYRLNADVEANFRTQHAFGLVEEKGNLGVWSWELESNKVKWSKGFFRLLGLEPGSVEPSYDLLESVTHPADLRPSAELGHLLTEGGTFERKFRIFHRDGRVRWVLSRGEFLPGQNGRSKQAMGVLTDITWLHAAEARAQATQNRLSFLIVNEEGLPGDRHGWCKLTGQTLEETRNSGWLNAIHPDDRDATRTAWNSAIANCAPYETLYRLHRADGVFRWFRARAKPVLNQDKSIREWLGVCFDVHDQKMTSASLEDTRITGVQIRGARGILKLSVRDIAETENISSSTIRRLEETDGPAEEPDDDVVLRLKAFFENAGVEFLFPFAGKPGVRPC